VTVTEIVLFHSVLGVRAGVCDIAARLAASGHTVHVIDLFDGASFDGYEPAFAHVQSLGGDEALITKAAAAVADLPAEVVYAGLSMGAASAVHLAATRPGARGLIGLHGAVSPHWFGVSSWPDTVPVQVHEGEYDPFREPDEIAALGASVRAGGARFEHFVYPDVRGHLFSDASLPNEYDGDAAELMLSRLLEFVK